MWNHVLLLIILLTSFVYFSKKIHIYDILFILRKIKFHLFFFTLYFICMFLSFFSLPLFLLLPRNIWNLKHCAQVLKHLTILCSIKWEVRNSAVLSEKGGAVVIANHQRSLDTLGMFNIWHKLHRLTPIAKKDFLYAFPFGLAAYLGGVVFIDSNKKEETLRTLRKTADDMLKYQKKIWIFPEGKHNSDVTEFLPFKKGAFQMAVSTQAPIIPIVFSPYYFIDNKKYTFRKGHVILQCLDPIPTEGLTKNDLDDLIKRVRDKMADTYKNLSDEVTHQSTNNHLLAT